MGGLPELRGLRVAFVAGTLGQGGAERQLFYMVKALAESQAKPRVLCLTRGEFWEQPIRSLGVDVDAVGASPSKLARLRAIIGAARRDRPAILQSQHFYTNLYAIGAARALGVTEVGAIRCNTSWEVADLGPVLGRLSLRTPRAIAANSRAAIGTAIALGVKPDRLHFLPNAVDTGHFTPAPAHTNGRLRLLSVGRRAPQKRFDRLLTVLAGLRRRSTRPMTAIVVTTGNVERRVLERQAVDLGFGPDDVEFRENVADMAPLYRCADVHLLTSDWEGTPNVVLEAMASGLPVVATRVGGVPEIVTHGETGYLVDPDDETGFVDSMLRLVDDDAHRAAMGGRARAFIEERHAVSRLPATLRDFYGRLQS